MPTIAQRQPAPTLIRDNLPLPTAFPDLPDDVMKRFPSLADWQANKDKWWKRAYVALQDSNGSVSQTVTNTRANQDSLRAQFISTSGTFTASLATEITIRANADAALATRATNLEASVDTPTTGLLARVTVIETTYATTTSVSAAISAAISAEVTNRNTAITASAASLTSAYVAADSVLNTALGTRITALEASVDTPTTGLLARVTTIETTYATDSDVTASVSSAISAEITNRNTAISAAVSTESSARATADGFLAGKYTLKVAAGDVVTGMNITSSTGAGTDVSDVTFVAANFKIYNGTTGVTMFNVSGSTVQLAGTLTVSTSGKVFIGTGTYADSSTAFYVDSAGQFSLKDKLTWDGSTLTINGNITTESGTIGGFTIGTDNLSCGTGSSRIVLASTGVGVVSIGSDATTSDVLTIHSSTGLEIYYATAPFTLDKRAELTTSSNYGFLRLFGNSGSGSNIILNASTGNAQIPGTVTAGTFSGSGASITSLSASNISSGTLDVARLPADIDVSGYVRAGTGYAGRAGVGGITSNLINISWDGTFNHIWTDTTDVGAVVVAGAYVSTPATSAGYALMKTTDGTLRKFMIGT